MSKGVNKCIILGNVGQDPETRYSASGFCFASLSVATSESWKDKNTGEKQEKTEWHRVSIQGKLGEIAGEYIKKGSKIYVEGKLQTRKWQDQSGQDRYTTEVVVDSFTGVMQMLDGKPAGEHGATSQQAAPAKSSPKSPPPSDMNGGFDDDSIPF